MGENLKLDCPSCGEGIALRLTEFVDVESDPYYKDQIINGDFFFVTCPVCGDSMLIEYPMMYMDPSKKLNVYMATEHDYDLIDQLNSVEIPEEDIDPEAIFRVVTNSIELLEIITIYDHNRDDKIIQLYKLYVWDQLEDEFEGEFEDVEFEDMLYVYDNECDEEYILVLSMENDEGENLTIELNEELYDSLAEQFGELFEMEPNKYDEIDKEWLYDHLAEYTHVNI